MNDFVEMNDTSRLILDPVWLQAVADFIALKPEPGFILEKEWLYEHLGLEQPDNGTKKDFDKFSLDCLDKISKFREALLENHKIALKTKAGVGYIVLAPNEHANEALDHAKSNIKKVLRNSASLLVHTNFEELTDAERAEHHQAVARIGGMRSLLDLSNSRQDSLKKALESLQEN